MTGNLMAILRGITPNESESIAEPLIENGIDQIEVPLNSPDAFASIHRIAKKMDAVDEVRTRLLLHQI